MVGTALDLSSAFSSGELDHSRGYWLTPSPVSVSSSNSPIHLSWFSDRAFRAYQSTLVNSNRPDCHGGSLLFPSPPPTCAERRPYAAETTVVVGSCLGVGITGHISARTVIWKTGLGPALSGGTTTVSLQILSSDSLLIAPSCHPRLLILSLNQQEGDDESGDIELKARPVYVAVVDLCSSEEFIELIKSALLAALEALYWAPYLGW